MRRLPRWLIFTTVVVVLALASLSSLAVGTARRSLPQVDGQLNLSMLSRPVEVRRDAHGVPQIYAENPEDLFAAQGYVHAQDRFFEMDVRRHFTSGRLSEIFGPTQVAADSYIRTMGWRRVAEEELTLLSSRTRRYLDAYASGVNGYIAERSSADLSLEYSLLGVRGLDYEPDPWTAADSLAWSKAMAWTLSANSGEEIERSLMTASLGADRTAELFPDHLLEQFAPIVTQGSIAGGRFDINAGRGSARPAPPAFTPRQLSDARKALISADKARTTIPPFVGQAQRGPASGSNAWVVAGDRTDTGKPVLANDPHLATSMPSVFTQVGLHCRAVSTACPFDVTGFSFSGSPGVVIGKNAHLGWGLSNAYTDAQDLYLEEVRRNTVRVGTKFVPLDTRTEQISVFGEDQPRTITIRSSRHGPLLSDVDSQLQAVGAAPTPPSGSSYAVSLRWTALEPGRSMDAIFGMNAATSVQAFRSALRLVDAPSQNVVYADITGNIGYQLAGSVPIRGAGDGRTPAPGWDAAYDWKSVLPFDQLPEVQNPPQGYIVAANQPIIGDQYPRPLGSNFSYGWRSQEILDRLNETRPITADAMEQIFYDDTIRFAADLVPTLLKIKVRDPWIAEGQRTLVGWDYSAAADSAAAAYFQVLFHNVLKLTFRDQMPTELWPTGGDRWYAVVAALVKQPANPWWDDTATPDVVEKRDDILLAAMTAARKEMTSLVSRDTDRWQWGRIHRVTLTNTTLGVNGFGMVERLFNRGNLPVGGGPAVVNAMGYNDEAGYAVTNGPAMRMLINFAELDRSRWVNQSGASGHPFTPTYDDQLPMWAGNRMWDFVSSKPAVDAATVARLEMQPGG
ncbi:MAG TPA: penicillin acylase family protein [Propionibacteriaceae bacterium]|nr:penicillin acylase family protein [Propionibacteriaceae bacterium]